MLKWFLILSFPCTLAAQPSAFAMDFSWMEIMPYAGYVVPNHAGFPSVKPQSGLQFSYAKRHFSKPWSAWYNHPSIGAAVSWADLGNDEVFGSSLSVFPFIELYTGSSEKRTWIFRLSLGVSRFSRFYKVGENQDNIVVGSRYTWGFHAHLGRNLISGRKYLLRAYVGYLHGSNGHVQLPNFGINSGVIGLAAQWRSTIPYSIPPRQKFAGQRVAQPFVMMRSELGVHELGGTVGPVGGDKQGVYALSLGGGILWRRHLQVRSGFTYRRYTQYEQYIKQFGPEKYQDKPARYASSLHYFLACEFLIGHVGLDIEGGLNIHKPFYREFNALYENTEGLKYWLKQLFPTRMGLKVYAVNTTRASDWNAFIGAHINANFGEADFTSFSVGLLRYFEER